MGTTSEWIRNLKLRNKLAAVYTAAFIIVLGVTFIVIYSISEKYRKEEFYKRLSDRTFSTFKISIQVDQIDNKTLKLFDQNTINSLYDESILLFDSSGRLIYSSVDSADISYATYILERLKTDESVYVRSDDKYELLGSKFIDRAHTYYCIARAYDQFGKSKIRFLALLLVCTFVIVTGLMLALSFFLSRIVTRPITRLTSDLNNISPENLSNRIRVDFNKDEVGFLADKFNELLEKVEDAFKFQFHYINYLSHELKTPLAIMMANAERSLVDDDSEKLKASMQFQKNAIMDLSHIINAMLDISRMENKLSVIHAESIRIDETIFECMEEITLLNEHVRFEFAMIAAIDEKKLTVQGNSRMIKMAVLNLIKNAVNFSVNKNPTIQISASGPQVHITITNDGETISPHEQSRLFEHSFRGRNSLAVKGFGLGLVLAHRVVNLHDGSLIYSVTSDNRNCFVLSLPTA